MSTATLNPHAFSNLFAQVCATQQLTLTDRYNLQAVILGAGLNSEERGCLDRLLYSVRRGRITLQ